MMNQPRAKRKALNKAFTLVELMIVVALIGIVVTLAAPSFRDMILKQRLRGISAQLATDLAFARSEAVSRGVLVGVRTQVNGAMSCYIINTRTSLTAPLCDCTLAAGLRCADAAQTTEIRTVQVPIDMGVGVGVPAPQADSFTFDPRTGGMKLGALDLGVYDASGFLIDAAIDPARKLRTSVGVSGRVAVCTPSGSQMGGAACS